MTYRLHIDIPIHAADLDEAQRTARSVMDMISKKIPDPTIGITEVNYRLGHDEDRQKSNYLDMDERGHCSHRKTKIKREA